MKKGELVMTSFTTADFKKDLEIWQLNLKERKRSLNIDSNDFVTLTKIQFILQMNLRSIF